MAHYVPRILVPPLRWLAWTALRADMLAYVAGTPRPWWSACVEWLIERLPPIRPDK